MVKQVLGLAERPVGGQECSDELRIGVHVIRESLDQLEKGAALDEWTLTPVLVVFKHDVLIRVFNSEPGGNTDKHFTYIVHGL